MKGVLSHRQWEVLELVLEGHSSKEIARRLGVTEKTVGSHRAAIRVRTGCRKSMQLYQWALDHATERRGAA